MNKAAVFMSTFLALCLLTVLGSQRAFAHEETIVGDIKIVGGWTSEPPLVNQLNEIVLIITKNSNGEPITNAVAQLDITVKKGTETKPLEFFPAETSGVYVADIIPTQTGQYEIVFRGTISGQAIDSQIEIELVDDTRPIEFPPSSGGNPDPSDPQIEELLRVIADLNTQVEQAGVAAEDAVESAREATEAAADLRNSSDRAYLFGMVGVGVGVAGIIIGVIALGRSREKS